MTCQPNQMLFTDQTTEIASKLPSYISTMRYEWFNFRDGVPLILPYRIMFNPNSIGVKYSLIVLGGGFLHHVSVLTSLLVKKYFF